MTAIGLTTIDRLREIARVHFGVDPASVKPDTQFESFTGDDFDRLGFIAEVELEFSVDLSDDILHEARSVGDLVQVIEAASPAAAEESRAAIAANGQFGVGA